MPLHLPISTENQRSVTSFGQLLTIMDQLREKCPWDQKQTFESLSHLSLEEMYELYDAILVNDIQGISEEVGDLFLHLVFYSKILAESQGIFAADIIDKLNKKLIHRHPHVFETKEIISEEKVKQNWEKLKLKEGRKSIYSGVPMSLPSIVKAFRIQDKAAQVGFDWAKYQDVRAKLTEEIDELDEAIISQHQDNIEEELGDVLFTIVNIARFLKVDPEQALQKVNNKFIQRFQYIESNANKPIDHLTLEQMEDLWLQAKMKDKEST